MHRSGCDPTANDASYSGVMPAALITLPHFCVSAAWNCDNSCGVVLQGSEPDISKKDLAAVLATALFSNWLSLATTGAGVLAGA